MSDFPRAVLFDFDGVLVDSEPHHFAVFSDVLRKRGVEVSEQQYYGSMLGMTDRDSFIYVYRQLGRELVDGALEEMLAEKAAAMMGRIRGGLVQPATGAMAFVEALARRCPLGICSGALRQEIEATLAAMGLARHFRTIVAAGEAPGKPDPAGYLLAMKQLSAVAGLELRPADCLIVEDSPTVTTRVREVGFRVLAIAASVPAERLAHADYVAASLDSPVARETAAAGQR